MLSKAADTLMANEFTALCDIAGPGFHRLMYQPSVLKITICRTHVIPTACHKRGIREIQPAMIMILFMEVEFLEARAFDFDYCPRDNAQQVEGKDAFQNKDLSKVCLVLRNRRNSFRCRPDPHTGGTCAGNRNDSGHRDGSVGRSDRRGHGSSQEHGDQHHAKYSQ